MLHLSIYAEDLVRRAFFGDLFELTIETAAEILHECISGSAQVSLKDIECALQEAVIAGELIPVRGSVRKVGELICPPVLKATEVQEWAEKFGLLNDSDGPWHEYMLSESRIVNSLLSRLAALRKMESTGDKYQRDGDYDSLHNELVCQFAENDRLNDEIDALKEEVGHLKSQTEVDLHTRKEASLLNIIGGLLEIISGGFPDKVPHPSFTTEADLIKKLAETKSAGLSASNLQRVFPAAKRSYRSTF